MIYVTPTGSNDYFHVPFYLFYLFYLSKCPKILSLSSYLTNRSSFPFEKLQHENVENFSLLLLEKLLKGLIDDQNSSQ